MDIINLITFFCYFLIFVSGSIFGSFLKLVSDRSVNGESILTGRSKCDHCGKSLKPISMIPIISYFLQKGKCSFCKKPYSILYPLSEFMTGSLFFGTAYYLDIFNNFNIYTLIYFAFVCIVISFYIIMIFSDISYFIIPDKIVYTAIAFVFGFVTFNFLFELFTLYINVNNDVLGKYLIQAGYLQSEALYMFKIYLVHIGSSLGISAFFYSLILLTKGKGMGGGDVKLGLLIGLFNGFASNIIGIFLGFIFGSVFSVFLIILGRKKLKDIIPFGPFLIAGSLVAFFFGNVILNWYIGLI